MKLRLELPDSVAEALGPNPERGALEAVLAELCFQGKVSVATAGSVLGLSAPDSIAWYSGRGHDNVAYPAEELDEEITHMDELARRR